VEIKFYITYFKVALKLHAPHLLNFLRLPFK